MQALDLSDSRISKPVVLMGDLNTRLDKPERRRTVALVDTLADFGLWLVTPQTTPTFESHKGKSVIDIFAVNVRREDVIYRGE